MTQPNQISYQKDDYFIDFSDVYKITEIKSETNKQGEEETYVYYKPLFPSKHEQSLDFSEPISCFERSYKRSPIEKKVASRLLNKLTDKVPDDFEFDADLAAEAVKLSNLEELAVILKYLWQENATDPDILSYNKQDLYGEIMTYMCRELSVVLKTDEKRVEEQILAKLDS
jgi:RNA polymerase-interacting CarD/CdnL/TRCF family regulator